MGATTTVDIVGIMSTEVGKARRKLATLAALGIGALLVFLSVPRILAYSQVGEVPSSVARALESGRDISTPVLGEALARYKNATSVLPHDAVLLQDLGRLELRRAAGSEDSTQRNKALRSASIAFKAAIVAAPARPFPWSLEAYAQSNLFVPSDNVVGLLRMSYFLGPHEASSILLRARVATGMWGELDEDVRQFTINDLEEIWHDGRLRGAIVPIYLEASMPTRSAIRKLILTDSVSEQRFNQMLKRALAPLKRS